MCTGSPAHINPTTMSYGLLDDLDYQQHGTGTPGACSSMAHASPGDLGQSQQQEQPTGDRRVTSRFRGLYFDVKHSSWRVRIFFQGKQRHIGRYKDETMAAQAYDRAAYYLYGNRANLNFRLSDVLADQSEVPASIKQAKEQAMCGHPARFRPQAAHVTSSSSSSSSTCSYSPHNSVQAFTNTAHPGAAAGGGFVPVQGPGGAYLQQHQHQQQLVRVAPQQQMLMQQQQGAVHHAAAGPYWPPAVQHQQLAAGAGASVQPHPGLMAPMQQPQQQPQPLVAGSTGLMVQQQGAPGVIMPDVVASVIAALDLPQSASPGSASACSASFGPWAGTSSSAGLGPVAVSAAGLVGIGSSGALACAAPGMALPQQQGTGSMPAPWMANAAAAASAAAQFPAPAAAMSSAYPAAYQQPHGLGATHLAGDAAVVAGPVMSLGLLEQQQQQQQQAYMLQQQAQMLQQQQQQQQQAHMQQFRAQGLAAGPGAQHHVLTSMPSGAAAVALDGAPGMVGVQGGMPVVMSGGVVLHNPQLGAAVVPACPLPQQQAVLTSTMM